MELNNFYCEKLEVKNQIKKVRQINSLFIIKVKLLKNQQEMYICFLIVLL
jgi:hypothetical protein